MSLNKKIYMILLYRWLIKIYILDSWKYKYEKEYEKISYIKKEKFRKINKEIQDKMKLIFKEIECALPPKISNFGIEKFISESLFPFTISKLKE